MKTCIFTLVFFLLAPGLLQADNAQVSAVLDKRSAEVNEEIHLTLRITGAQGNVQAPRLPDFKGFETFYSGRASHITFVNGQQTSRVEFSYTLVPKAAGQYSLGPIEVFVGQAVYRTEPIPVEILASQGNLQRTQPVPAAPPQSPGQAQQAPVQEPAPQFVPDDDNIFIQASIDKKVVYPNEPVILTYSLYTRYDTRYEGFAEEPEMSGFWIEEFPMDKDIRRDTIHINGKRYVKADIRKIALFPTAPAEYTIKPGTIKASIRQEPQNQSIFDEFFNDSFFTGSGFFSRRENRLLKPQPVVLQVIPFPEQGKPVSFDGAVGQFRMTASVDKQTVKQNEPVTMKLIIDGEGNIETLKRPPLPELKNFKIYDADTSSELFKTGLVIGGRKSFEIVFIPTAAGEAKIPALPFTYFDPAQKTYRTIVTQEFTIQVTPSDKPPVIPQALTQQDIFKKEIQVESKDIHFIHETLNEDAAQKTLAGVFPLILAADVLMTLLIFLGLWRERQENVFQKDSALKRRKFAKAKAEGRIRKLSRTLGREKDEQAFFEEVDKIITEYLSDKFNLSTYGTTRSEIESELQKYLETEDSLYQNILEIYRICDESRFAGQALPSGVRKETVAILRQAITRIERVKKIGKSK